MMSMDRALNRVDSSRAEDGRPILWASHIHHQSIQALEIPDLQFADRWPTDVEDGVGACHRGRQQGALVDAEETFEGSAHEGAQSVCHIGRYLACYS